MAPPTSLWPYLHKGSPFLCVNGTKWGHLFPSCQQRSENAEEYLVTCWCYLLPKQKRIVWIRSQSDKRISVYVPSVRRTYTLSLYILLFGVQGHNSPFLSHPPLARIDDSRYSGGQSFEHLAPVQFSLPLKHNTEQPPPLNPHTTNATVHVFLIFWQMQLFFTRHAR